MGESQRVQAARIGWLRMHVYEWTKLSKETWATRIGEIVSKRQEHVEPRKKSQGKWIWVITDFSAEGTGASARIKGVLHKVRDSAIEQAFDRRAWKMRDIAPIEGAHEASAPFVIFVHEHLLAHQIVGGITQAQFIETFRAVLERDGLNAPALNPLVREGEFMKEVRKLQRVTRVTVSDAHPTNPEDSPDFEKADDLLRQLKSRRADFKFESPDGLNLNRQDLISQLMSLAARGYGHASATGQEPGGKKVVTITTRTEALITSAKVVGHAGVWQAAQDQLADVYRAKDAPHTKKRKKRRSK